MVKKILTWIVVFFLAINIPIWVFNHINSWVGIIAGLLSILVLGTYVENQIKNKE